MTGDDRRSGPGAERVAVTVLARAPEPGRVKTRLAAAIGDVAACEVHEALARDVLERAARWLRGRGAPPGSLVLASTGDALRARSLERAALECGARVERQGSGDLGQRIAEAADRRISEGHEATIVLGSDSPELPDATLDGAVAGLATHEVVLAPAPDGGYVLFGARRLPRGVLSRALDGVEWGTERVLCQTEAACRARDLRVARAPGGDDVDTLDDLRTLAARLEASGADVAPRLRSWLAGRPPGVVD